MESKQTIDKQALNQCVQEIMNAVNKYAAVKKSFDEIKSTINGEDETSQLLYNKVVTRIINENSGDRNVKLYALNQIFTHYGIKRVVAD